MRMQHEHWRATGAVISVWLALHGCGNATPVASQVPSGVVPAKLAVTAPAGAEIHVDGVLVGNAPLASEILADPGPHQIGVVLDGHAPSLNRVVLERGKTRALEVDLETTAQRKAAWVLIGFGGAGVAAGIVLGALAVVEQRRADDLARESGSSGLDPERFDEFTAAAEARDRYRVGSGVAAGSGIVLFVTGALLYAFDEAVLPGGANGERSRFRLTPLLSPSEVGFLPTLHAEW
jgi:hypothetical protein